MIVGSHFLSKCLQATVEYATHAWQSYQQLRTTLAVDGIKDGKAVVWDERDKLYYSTAQRSCSCGAIRTTKCRHIRFIPLFLMFDDRASKLRERLERDWIQEYSPNLSLRFCHDRPNIAVTGGESRCVRELGCNPVPLDPEELPQTLWRSVYDRLDALFLWGGEDIPSQWSGGKDFTEPTARDWMELQMTRWAWAEDKPIFGICRGMQMLNVVLGGTLIQDIRSRYPRSNYPSIHQHDGIEHEIITAEDSCIRQLIGPTLLVNSLHHQALDRVAAGLRVVARSRDGTHLDDALPGGGDGLAETIEAVEKPWVLAVQFHPEFMPLEQVRRLMSHILLQTRPRHTVFSITPAKTRSAATC